jgi:hypothetical protein
MNLTINQPILIIKEIGVIDMKVYIVMEEVTIAGQDCERVMGIFSSNEKASEAAKEYEQHVNDSCWAYKYYWIEREVDEVWEQ